MAQCAIGDKVVCHIYNSAIVHSYEDIWHDAMTFDVISLYDEGYMLYVPENTYVKDSVTVTDRNHKALNINKRYIGFGAVYITDYKIIKIVSKIDGLACIKCETFYPMSSANQPDGTLVCWVCRNYKYYR